MCLRPIWIYTTLKRNGTTQKVKEVWDLSEFTLLSNRFGRFSPCFLVWDLSEFTLLSNNEILETMRKTVWDLSEFTLLSNVVERGEWNGEVWDLSEFTLLSNVYWYIERSLKFETYLNLHYSQTAVSVAIPEGTFETYLNLHYSQTSNSEGKVRCTTLQRQFRQIL